MNRLNPATDRVSMLHVRMPRRPAAGAARVRVVYLDVEAKLHAAAQPRLHYSFARHLSSRFRRTFRDTFRASDLDRGADYPVSLTRGGFRPSDLVARVRLELAELEPRPPVSAPGSRRVLGTADSSPPTR